MNLDNKITTWERIHFPSGKEEEILKKFKTGEITTVNELTTQYDNCDFSIVMNASEDITVEENDGQSTMEIFQNKRDTTPLWGNGSRRFTTSGPLLLEACKEFVRKVDDGEARSKRSYKQMTDAINAFDKEQ